MINPTRICQVIALYKATSNISQGHCVKSEESGDDEQHCSLATSSTDAIFGIALGDASAGDLIEVQFGGVFFSAVLGDSITAGCFLTANAEGKLVAAAPGDRYIGFALPYSGMPSSGSTVEIMISQGVIP